MHRRTLFIFRQDLRTFDNLGLSKAIEDSDEIIPLFIFDTTRVKHFPSNDTRIGFLIEAVQRLEQALIEKGGGLLVQIGDPVHCIPTLIQEYGITAVYYNRSYGSGSLQRDREIHQRCQKNAIVHRDCADYLLVEPETTPVRKVFTPYYSLRQAADKRIELISLDRCKTPPLHKVSRDRITQQLGGGVSTRSADAGPHLLTAFSYTTYSETRNIPSLEHGTSKLSPYLRFGLLSCRQILRHVLDTTAPRDQWNDQGIHYDTETGTVTFDKKRFSHTYISELARREFRQHIAVNFPESRHLEFQEKRRHMARDNNEQRLLARTRGETGYPIVDAGMRQLLTEHRMHNRVRMIVASFLTKDLLIDRRHGEAHFAEYLLDYDENVNIGNRQRSASVGADPKPVRIFNPILQSQRFDPYAEYILKRIPELKHQPLAAIHDPLTHTLDYHPPIVNHYVRSKQAKELYYPPQRSG